MKTINNKTTPNRRLRILVSNDDGISSDGILALARALAQIAQVTVVAPEREQSTMGHALTLHKPLRVFHVRSEPHLDLWATSGTPADCVYMGLRHVLKGKKPDLIVSGINRGANLGNDIYYSGTIAAAREGAVMDIPAIACSLNWHYEPGKVTPTFDWAAQYMVSFVKSIMQNHIPPGCLINVNFPNLPLNKVKGVKVARQGFLMYTDKIIPRKDNKGKPYFWLGGKYAGYKDIKGSDCEVLDKGYISVTPFRIDLTQYDYMETLAKWIPGPQVRVTKAALGAGASKRATSKKATAKKATSKRSGGKRAKGAVA
jgi:5'-nucleotidase